MKVFSDKIEFLVTQLNDSDNKQTSLHQRSFQTTKNNSEDTSNCQMKSQVSGGSTQKTFPRCILMTTRTFDTKGRPSRELQDSADRILDFWLGTFLQKSESFNCKTDTHTVIVA